jgi:hypothetical protein
VDLAVKVATPIVLVVPDTVVMVSLPSRLEESETNLLLTGLPFASLSVTVIVDVVDPSAATDAGEAVTVDTEGLTAPAVKVTVACWVMVTLSVVSVALMTSVPVPVALTVPVVTPEALVIALGWVMENRWQTRRPWLE